MSTTLAPLGGGAPVPLLVAAHGDAAAIRYVEFFTANIRNPNTRAAYARAARGFFAWSERQGLTLARIQPVHVAAWLEMLGRDGRSAPTVKQHLAAVRMLFDWLVVGQVVASNPAAPVRGPRHVVRTGKTPVLEGGEWRRLIDAIPTATVRDLRDRALLATLSYSFARIGAALAMRIEDVVPQGAGWYIRLHEKGGRQHAMPCHHALAEALHVYLAAMAAAGGAASGTVGGTIGGTIGGKSWLFRSAPGTAGASRLGERAMRQPDAWRMIRRRAALAGIATPIGCHSFRATGITAYLANGGTLEHAQSMAAHESPRTTKLYDRTRERLTREEVERIRF